MIKSKRLRIFNQDGWRCLYCGNRVEDESTDATVDHIVPVSLVGSHDDANLRTSCRPCNITKGDRSEEWLRLYWAISKTKYAGVITISQYHKLLGLGAKLGALHHISFHFEARSL